MRKNIISLCALGAALLIQGCSEYDDSALWKQVDEAQKQVAELTESLSALKGQIELLAAAKTGGVITSVMENPDGGVTVSYMRADGTSATAVLAKDGEQSETDIIGTKEEGGVLYWTITSGGKTVILTDVDGAKIPVAGRTPSITTDKDGWWMVNGVYVLDGEGNKVKSSGRKASLVSSAVKNGDGTVTLVLADGSSLTVDTAESFMLRIYLDGEEVRDEIKVEDGVTSLEFTYKLSGNDKIGRAHV